MYYHGISTRDMVEKNQKAIQKFIEWHSQTKACKEHGYDSIERCNDLLNHASRLHEKVIRWWRVVKTTNGNVIAYTNNSQEVFIINNKLELIYDDEVKNHGLCIQLARNLDAIFVKATRKELINLIINNFDDIEKIKSNLLPPVHLL